MYAAAGAGVVAVCVAMYYQSRRTSSSAQSGEMRLVHDLDPQTIAILRSTWKESLYPAQVEGSSFDPVDNIMLLYNKMFELDPEQAALFHGRDVRVEAKRFAKMMGTILASLDQEKGHTIIEDMGRRHVIYGIKPRMFDIQALAVVHMAQSVLFPLGQWTPTTKDAWVRCYAHIVKHMKAGALQDPEAKAMGY